MKTLEHGCAVTASKATRRSVRRPLNERWRKFKNYGGQDGGCPQEETSEAAHSELSVGVHAGRQPRPCKLRCSDHFPAVRGNAVSASSLQSSWNLGCKGQVSETMHTAHVHCTTLHMLAGAWKPLNQYYCLLLLRVCSIDDDTWSEKADPTTGFVFHIDSSTKLARLDSQPSADGGPHPLTISHSSSSLSSTQSATDVVSPASPTAIVNSPVGLSSR